MRTPIPTLCALLALAAPAMAQDAPRPAAERASPPTARASDAEGNPAPALPGAAEDPNLTVPTGLPPSTQPGATADPGTAKAR